jgi:thermitase
MLTQLYPFAFLLSLLTLIGWFFFQNASKLSSLLQIVFFGAFTTYLVSIIAAEATMTYKLSILFRDLLIISGLSAGFSMLKNHKTAFFLMVLASGIIYQMYFKEKLAQTFSAPVALSENKYDQNGEILLEIASGRSQKDLSDIISRFDLTFTPAFTLQDADATELDDYWLVDIPKSHESQMDEIILALREIADVVDHVEANEWIMVSPTEEAGVSRKNPIDFQLNDPDIIKQWSFEQTGVADYYQLLRSEKIQAKKKAHIFILDTGVDGSHEDLRGNYVSLKSKYDSDPIGHGTHCAGVAAAVSNNSIGIASLALDDSFVKVSSIKVLNNLGGGSQKMIVDGILEAADNGADVISMSLGGVSQDLKQKAYSDAVAYANKKGAIVVVAAGNNNGDAKSIAPANAAGVITVAAVDTLLGKASFSNFITNIEKGIAAPGTQIYSTIPENKYAAFNGTSMATPYVAGLLGIMKSLRPELTTGEAYQILKSSGKDSREVSLTGRVIQPAEAIRMLLD